MNLRKPLFVALTLIAVFNLPSKAMAEPVPGIVPIPSIPMVPITLPAIEAKETGIKIFGINLGISWDSLAINAAKAVLERIVDSTVEWINTGFDGGPGFVTDPESYFANIADGVAGEFIQGSDLGFLCSPFQANIRINLSTNYTKSRPFQCTLTGIKGNIEDFYEDFDAGGWDGWFSMTQNAGNNPYGAYVAAEGELNERIAKAVGIKQDQLNWGRGFLSKENCTGTGPNKVCTTVTPGSVIESQLQNVLGTQVSQLELADEFDELIGALLGQLLQKTVFSDRGLSSGHTTKGGSGVAGGGNRQDTQVSCFANPTNVTLGDPVTWTAASSLFGNTVVYSWEGEGLTGQRGQTASTTYSTASSKTARVTATAYDELGTEIRSVTASCSNQVMVSRYRPLTLTCAPTVTSAKLLPDTETRGLAASVTWKGTITGGSGRIINIDMDSEDEYNKEAPQLPTRQTVTASSTEFTGGWKYEKTGNKTAKVSIIDQDSTVLPLVDTQCQGSVYIYK